MDSSWIAFGDFVTYIFEAGRRDLYLGKTPSKNSSTGKKVQARMRSEGTLRDEGGKVEVYHPDTGWVDINQTDMSHIRDAVDYWNTEGYKHGPKSPPVREWMRDPKNYTLEPNSLNRQRGGRSGQRYRDPL